MNNVLKDLSPKDHSVDVRDDPIERTAQRIFYFMPILKYDFQGDLDALQALLQEGAKEDFFYPLLHHMLSNLPQLRKRAYMAQYLTDFDLPEDMFADPEVMQKWQEHKELQEHKEMRVHKELQVHKEIKVLQVHRELKVIKVLKVIKEQLEHKEQLELKEQQVHREQQVHKELLDTFNFALVWGSSAKHHPKPQRVGLAHELEDEDVLQVVTKTNQQQRQDKDYAKKVQAYYDEWHRKKKKGKLKT